MDKFSSDDFPVPSKREVGKPTALKREKKKMGTEMAAMAYVAMEAGEWVYAPGTRRQFDDDGVVVPNKAEVMRRAGYRGSSVEMFNKFLGEDDYFWEMVELFRIRRTDPMFRKDNEHLLWQQVGGESLRALYERVQYAPHQISLADHIKIVKLILDAGITLNKLGSDTPNRSDELLDGINDPLQRKKLIDGYKDSLDRERSRIEDLERAHKGADNE